MSKLNAWKRMGIVASVVWIIGARSYALHRSSAEDERFHNVLIQECMAPPNDWGPIYEKCLHDADVYSMSQLRYEWIDAGLVAFIPVPFLWGFFYLLLFTVRWVRRGFARPL